MRAIGESDPDYAPARDKAMALFRLIETKCRHTDLFQTAKRYNF